MIVGENTNIRLFRLSMDYLVVAQTETLFLKQQIKYRENAIVLSLGRSGYQPLRRSALPSLKVRLSSTCRKAFLLILQGPSPVGMLNCLWVQVYI
jgi:hypothetical protein